MYFRRTVIYGALLCGACRPFVLKDNWFPFFPPNNDLRGSMSVIQQCPLLESGRTRIQIEKNEVSSTERALERVFTRETYEATEPKHTRNVNDIANEETVCILVSAFWQLLIGSISQFLV